MKIVIVGCGKIGEVILQELAYESHEIVAVDTDSKVIQNITDNYDVMGICANGTHFNTLSDAKAGSAELFVATTPSDEINMLCCFLAKRMGAKHTVARIRGQEYSTENLDFLKHQLEISMVINPELLTARAINNIIKFPSATKSEAFTRGRFEMAELTVKPNSAFDGAVLVDLRKKLNAAFLVCSVLRDKKTYIPKGDFVIHEGDRLGIIAASDEMQKLLKNAGMLQKRSKDIMILGASASSLYLSKLLTQNGNSVKIIENSESRCNEICGILPRGASVICGDGTNHILLSEEGLEDADAFVTLTGMDEENILSSYYAQSMNVPKVITKVNRSSHDSICEKLGLDCVVSPKRITADIVAQYARALQNSMGSKVETLYSLLNGQVEALEFDVSKDFSHLNTALKDLSLKPDILIAGIIRGDKTIIPNGFDVILPHDRVIVIAAGQKLYDLSDVML